MISIESYKDDNGVDLIQTAYDAMLADGYITQTQYDTYMAKPYRTIWAMYRYRFMNCCPCDTYIDRWKQRFMDIAYTLTEKYDLLFTAYESIKADGSIVGLTSKTKVVGNDTGHVGSSGSNDDTSTVENIPQYADAASGEWLSVRNKANGTNASTIDTNTDSTITTESALGLLPAELAEKMRNALFNPYAEYAKEFDSLFVPFYIDECGCGC